MRRIDNASRALPKGPKKAHAGVTTTSSPISSCRSSRPCRCGARFRGFQRPLARICRAKRVRDEGRGGRRPRRRRVGPDWSRAMAAEPRTTGAGQTSSSRHTSSATAAAHGTSSPPHELGRKRSMKRREAASSCARTLRWASVLSLETGRQAAAVNINVLRQPSG